MPDMLHVSTGATWAWYITWLVENFLIAVARYCGQQTDTCFSSKFHSMLLFLMYMKLIAKAMFILQLSI